MLRSLAALAPLATLALLASPAGADSPYTTSAGKSAPTVHRTREVWDEAARAMRTEGYEERPSADRWGNAQGNQHDLAVDGAFEGQTVAVMQLYVDGSFDFSLPKAALAEKGFSTYRWINSAPPPDELAKALEKSSQLWIISGSAHQLTPAHVAVIKRYFDAGHGVYIWGDNDPYYTDANVVAEALLGTHMHGDLMGDHVVGLLSTPHAGGIKPNHLLSTGLENIYEGITIATIDEGNGLEPLIYGSAGNLVAAYYDKGGKRAILDGGFTRLYMKWDTAGTARYVKNAAAWLVNAERFGDAVVSPRLATRSTVSPPPSPVTDVPPPPLPPRSSTSARAHPQPVGLLGTAKMGYVLVALLAGLLALLYLPRRFR